MSLFVRSILWDLNVPQHAATSLYEDNDGATAMANEGKPTTRTRHMDIKYYALAEWVERDLLLLKRIPTSINMSDHFTKPLARLLYHRHRDFYMGFVPPTYSPKYQEVTKAILLRVPTSTTPAPVDKTTEYTAAAARTTTPWDIITNDIPWSHLD